MSSAPPNLLAFLRRGFSNEPVRASFLNGSNAVLLLIQSAFVIRILEKSEYGRYAIIGSILVVVQTIIGMRSGELVLRYLNPEEKDKVRPTLFGIFKIDAFLNLAVFLMVLATSFFLSAPLDFPFMDAAILSTTIPLGCGVAVIESFLIVYKKIRLSLTLRFWATALTLPGTILLAHFYGYYGLLTGTVLSCLARTLLYAFTFSAQLVRLNIPATSGKAPAFHGIWDFSFHSFLSTTLKSGVSGLDVLLLAHHSSQMEVAVYKAAKNLAGIPGIILGSAWQTKQPILLEMLRLGQIENFNSAAIRFQKPFLVAFLMAVPVLFYFSGDIMEVLFGSDYAGGGRTLFLLLGGTWLSYSLFPLSRLYYLATNRMGAMTALNGVGFLLLVVFSYLAVSSEKMAALYAVAVLFPSLWVSIRIFLGYRKPGGAK